MSTEDGNRLSRWSRLKRKRAQGEVVEEPPARGAAAPVVAPAPDAAAMPAEVPVGDPDDQERELTEEEAAYVETLPKVEELTAESDFTGFMDKRVPEFLRRRALRKLWLSDPAFSFLDGMNEYDEDYSMIVELAAGASNYRPDQGGYAWQDKPKTEDADGAAEGDEVAEAPDEAEEDTESLADKAARVQDRGGSDVRARTYTANPYYQAPGQRGPAPERLPQSAGSGAGRDGGAGDDDDLGDAEDEFS